MTVVGRNPYSEHQIETRALWSYAELFNGNRLYLNDIILNILMFCPIGFIICWNLNNKNPHKVIRKTFLYGIGCSATIEVLQLIFKVGLFEVDDIINNSLGAVIGAIGFCVIAYILKRYGLDIIRELLVLILCVLAIIVSCRMLVVRNTLDDGYEEKEYCFQLETIEIDDRINLTGYCFAYSTGNNNFTVLLKSLEDSQTLSLDTRIGLPRYDVNDYYKCQIDYSHCGFYATGDIDNFNINEPFEILIKWDNNTTTRTGVFVCENDIQYALESLPCNLYDCFPNQLNDAILLVADNTISEFYVFQKEDKLYWVIDSDFPRDDSHTTVIQYQLWTTQPMNLPANRVANGWDWDVRNFVFEDCEISEANNNTGYRIAVCDIPTEYPITAIATGYYNNKWLLRRYFRPTLTELIENRMGNP